MDYNNKENNGFTEIPSETVAENIPETSNIGSDADSKTTENKKADEKVSSDKEDKGSPKITKQAVKYFLCMISAGVIEFLSYLLLVNVLPIPEAKTIHFINDASLLIFISELVSLAISIIWNFSFNRKFTFQSSNNVPVSMALAFLFYVPFYPFALWFVPTVTPYLGSIIAKLIKMVINAVLEFLWQKFVLYGKFGNWVESKISKLKANKKM